MVLEWPDFSFLMIGSLDEKESENRKWSKLVENHPINQFWHWESIGNGLSTIGLLFLGHWFPWWKRVRKSKMFQIGRKSSHKPILTWGIDWKWFQNDSTSLSWSSAPLMKKSPKIENVPNWSKLTPYANFDIRNRLKMVSEWSDFSFLLVGSLDEKDSENRKCSKLVENHPIN